MKFSFHTEYKLWIDDQASDLDVENWRRPPANEPGWKIAHSSDEAKMFVDSFGPPSFISFDHDLGILNEENDTAMVFCKWFEYHYPTAIDNLDYDVHSANPIGAENIKSFMDSWKRSRTL